MAKKTTYLLTMAKTDNGTNVGCIAVTVKDDKIIKQKTIIDVFPGKDIREEVFAKWAWVKTIPEEDKIWVSTKTPLDDILRRVKDRLIARVTSYHPFEFVSYGIIDLLNHFNESNNRDATSFEVNIILVEHTKRVLKHFEEYPSEKSDFPILEYLKTQYAHTGEIISLDSITKSFSLIK